MEVGQQLASGTVYLNHLYLISDILKVPEFPNDP